MLAIGWLLGLFIGAAFAASPISEDPPTDPDRTVRPHETYGDPPARQDGAMIKSPPGGRITTAAEFYQVNVDADGNNIKNDAANEPSICVDPRYPWRMAIGWRQFDSIKSNFREAGAAWSDDAGRTWHASTLSEGEFRTDPVLDADRRGNFYYYSLYGQDLLNCDAYKSTDGGRTWRDPVPAGGGDKNWMIVDPTDGIGDGHVYCIWREDYSCCGRNIFTRSTDGGDSFEDPVPVSQSPALATMAVGPEGDLFVAGVLINQRSQFRVAKSSSARDPGEKPVFESVASVNLGGPLGFFSGGPNPDGLLGQSWVVVDRSGGERDGYVYLLCSVDPSGNDPLDVRFSRSTDGGATWSTAIRVNDDPSNKRAYQWFGTLSIAPNGRLDAIWNDTRDDANPPNPQTSRVYYSFSTDGGETWSTNEPLTSAWNHFKGYPNQRKIGDYYHMVSDNVGANLAFAATFNDEQDIYFMRIGAYDCNGNSIGDGQDLADGTDIDLNGNGIPDVCDQLGDLNCDFATDFGDIDPFVLILTDLDEYLARYPGCDPDHGDINGDHSIDFADIDPFVALLTR